MFNLVRSTPFTISISPMEIPKCGSTPGYLSLKIGENTAEFVLCEPNSSEPTVLAKTTENNPGFVPGVITTYWYSFDHSNLVVKYGKGYVMEETTLLQYNFIPENATADEEKEIRKNTSFIFSPKVKKVVMLYDVAPLTELKELYSALSSGAIKISNPDLYKVGTKQKFQIVKALISSVQALLSDDDNQGQIEVAKKVDFYNFPLVSNLPPFVIDSSKVTLYDLDENKYMFSASLPTTCIELYSNVINSDLNWSPIPTKYKFTDALRYSIETPGCLLYNKLKEKQDEAQFGAKNEVYLRVTLGPQRGQSPGVPYVLEIWPKGCGSPIHNHGNTFAVIHVLHGGLTITVYNKYMPDEQELKQFSVKEGDVTWISPNWYQTHKLWNSTDDYCATIQCYQYGDNNNISWPYFDYLGTTDLIDEFLPDSDFDFLPMKTVVMAEYIKFMISQGY